MTLKKLLVFSFVMLNSLLSLKAQKNIPATITHNSTSRSITSLDYSMNAVLWQQRSGEYEADKLKHEALAEY